MRILCILLIVLFSLSKRSYAQQSIPYISLEPENWIEHSTVNSGLDSLFRDKRIIGLGEATHGTREFTTVRHTLIRYLVEKKGFNTFILEADVSGCQRLNRYINGFPDDAKGALSEVQYWVWNTYEMLEIIEWMREYNQTHPHKIQFIGCDMQSFIDDKIEIPRLMKNDSTQSGALGIFDGLKRQGNDTASYRKAYSRWNQFYTALNFASFTVDERNQWNLMNNSLQQFFEHKFITHRDYNFRDSCMAETINTYIIMHPNARCIYFAHNAHVSDAALPIKNSTSFRSTGSYLNEKWKKEYASVALTCGSGRFNAFTVQQDSMQIAALELTSIRKNSIEQRLSKIDSPIFLCEASSIKRFHKLYITDIGALYGKISKQIQKGRFSSLRNRKYDYILFIKETKESTLINPPKKRKVNKDG